jgi:hypothetical protein
LLKIIGTPSAAHARATARSACRENGHRQPVAEQRGRQVALLHVAQHARHDHAPREGRTIGVHGAFQAGATNDVRGRVGGHGGRGAGLERGGRHGHRGALARHAPHVDVGLHLRTVERGGARE